LWCLLVQVLYEEQRKLLNSWFPQEVAFAFSKNTSSSRKTQKKVVQSSSSSSDSSSSSSNDSSSDSDIEEEESGQENQRDTGQGQGHGPYRPTLGNHNHVHLPDEIKQFAALSNVSTGIYEHAQGNVAAFAKRSTRLSGPYALVTYAALLQHQLSQVQSNPMSSYAKQVEAAKKTITINSSKLKQSRVYKAEVVYYGLPLFSGAIVIRILNFNTEAFHYQRKRILLTHQVFEFGEILELNNDAQEARVAILNVPHLGHFLQPFPLKYKYIGHLQDQEFWPFCFIHRVVFKGPAFDDRSNHYTPNITFIYPSRFLTANKSNT
jgi:hypothetical protein